MRCGQESEGSPQISPWHDIPFTLGKDEHGVPLLSFVCEIPRGTRKKFEIHKSASHNPLLQDVHKNGTLREYVRPHVESKACVAGQRRPSG